MLALGSGRPKKNAVGGGADRLRLGPVNEVVGLRKRDVLPAAARAALARALRVVDDVATGRVEVGRSPDRTRALPPVVIRPGWTVPNISVIGPGESAMACGNLEQSVGAVISGA